MARARILMVEDDQSLAEAVRTYLTLEGLPVDVVHNGRAAFEQLRAGAQYDVVVLDVQLPGLSGPQLLRWLRQEAPDTNVVVTTAFPSPQLRAEVLAEGALTLLAKPFNLDELVRLLAGLLSPRSATPPSPGQ